MPEDFSTEGGIPVAKPDLANLKLYYLMYNVGISGHGNPNLLIANTCNSSCKLIRDLLILLSPFANLFAAECLNLVALIMNYNNSVCKAAIKIM